MVSFFLDISEKTMQMYIMARPVKINTVIGDAIKNLGLTENIRKYESIQIWNDVVGKLISKKTRPKKVKGRKLLVEVENPVWMNELIFLKRKFINEINRRIGKRVIDDIIFLQRKDSDSDSRH